MALAVPLSRAERFGPVWLSLCVRHLCFGLALVLRLPFEDWSLYGRCSRQVYDGCALNEIAIGFAMTRETVDRFALALSPGDCVWRVALSRSTVHSSAKGWLEIEIFYA